jgi:hypothetical protein
MFDSYKNFLKADLLHMQNRYVPEGWLTANLMAMIIYHKLYTRLRDAKKLNKYAPKDIIELVKSIYKLKIKDEWRITEITKNDEAIYKLLTLYYPNLQS